MELRLYQKSAVDAVYNHLRKKDNNPCVVIPTGGGKTPVLATIIRDAIMEVNKTKRQNSPTLKNSQKFVKWGQWFNTRSNSEKVINFEITDFSMYGDFLPKIDASFS